MRRRAVYTEEAKASIRAKLSAAAKGRAGLIAFFKSLTPEEHEELSRQARIRWEMRTPDEKRRGTGPRAVLARNR